MSSSWGLTIMVLLIGMAVGSFLNVVIFRLPRRESVVSPRSKCLSCGAGLTTLDLVPVFSYIFLWGKCRHCGRAFSPRYMIVEVITGLSAVACLTFVGPNLYAVSVFAMICILIAIFFIDLDWMIIPDEMVLVLVGFGVSLNVLGIWRAQVGELILFTERTALATYTISLPRSIVGMVLGAGVFLLISWSSEKIIGRPTMGGGDVKLAGAMGALLGPGYQFLAFFLYAVFAGALTGLLAMAFRRKKRRGYIPFGPMLATSGAAMLLFPAELTAFFVRLYT